MQGLQVVVCILGLVICLARMQTRVCTGWWLVQSVSRLVVWPVMVVQWVRGLWRVLSGRLVASFGYKARSGWRVWSVHLFGWLGWLVGSWSGVIGRVRSLIGSFGPVFLSGWLVRGVGPVVVRGSWMGGLVWPGWFGLVGSFCCLGSSGGVVSAAAHCFLVSWLLVLRFS
jgi:hypothetical protein